MRAAGIVAEYNPMHMGHIHHIKETRATVDGGAVVVCMSGSFVQRGEPAVFSKYVRAEAAVRADDGADLVIELATPFSLSRAQRFAFESIKLLNATGVIDTLSFGTECGSIDEILRIADVLKSDEFEAALAEELGRGITFAAARQLAVERIAGESAATLLESPNNILALEYVMALDAQKCDMRPFTVKRVGVRHDGEIDGTSASASAVRKMLHGGDVEGALKYVPNGAKEVYLSAIERGVGPMSVSNIESAVMSQLRRMRPEDYACLQDVSEGLEYRLYSAAMQAHSFEEACEAAKTKRYSMARIRRLYMSAYLSLDEKTAAAGAQYIRVLAMNDKGRALIRDMRKKAALPVITKPSAAADAGEAAARLMHAESLACDLYALGFANTELRGAGDDLRAMPYIGE